MSLLQCSRDSIEPSFSPSLCVYTHLRNGIPTIMADMIPLIHHDFAPLIHVLLLEAPGDSCPTHHIDCQTHGATVEQHCLSYLNCHAERSPVMLAEPCHAEHIRYAQCKLREASRCPSREALRFAQGDTKASSLVAIEKCRNP